MWLKEAGEYMKMVARKVSPSKSTHRNRRDLTYIQYTTYTLDNIVKGFHKQGSKNIRDFAR
jgi:hypothetical protein